MRDFKGMKRQRGRNRGGGGQGGGGGKPQANINRAFDSNGPDNIKVRGNAQHVYEKYMALARDATLSGDRVLAENHLQHGEHYFRTLRAIQPNRAASEIVSRDNFASGYDIDFEDEAAETAMEQADAAAAARASEPQPEPSPEGETPAGEGHPQGGQPRFERDRADNGQRREWRDRNDRGDRPQGEFRDRQDRDRQDRDRGDRPRYEGDRPQGEFRDRQDRDRQDRDRQGGDRPQGEFRDRQDRDRQERGDRPRFRDREDRFRDREPRAEGDRPREDRPRDEREPRRYRDRDDRRFEPRPDGEPDPAAANAEPVPVLRSEDGAVSELPGFLQPAASPADEGAEGRRPRTRTRRPRREDVAMDDDGAPVAPEVEDA